MLLQIRKVGWLVVEAALLLVILCVLLNLLLGRDSGTFISGVATNTTAFLQAVPPGTFLGNETQSFAGSFLVSEPATCALGSADFPLTLNATWNGTPAFVDHVWVTLNETDLVSDFNLTLLDHANQTVASGDTAIDSNGTNGTGFPAGDYVLHVESCLSTGVDCTATLVARYVTV